MRDTLSINAADMAEHCPQITLQSIQEAMLHAAQASALHMLQETRHAASEDTA